MNKWRFYTAKEIKPQGWLLQQLSVQAKGLAGNLDKIWPDIRDSAWIGGTREGWERVPYWLDGFIPLAYLLDDDDMKARAKKYIDAILERQRPDGWICPTDNREKYDTWAVFLITKVLTVYYNCSDDPRIPEVIYKVLKNYYELLSSGEIKLFNWGKARWFECFIAINFVYERYKEEWLIDLGRLLKKQGTDYNDYIDRWKRPLNAWSYETHIVNMAMMLKAEAVSYHLLGEKYTDQAEKFRKILRRYNGTPVETFTGDECLSGISPIQGTELCSVVEQMYSYELLLAETGDLKWAKRLEILAFNALPATISDDMWTHQYVQMSNQVACERFPGKSLFRTNNEEAHLFGLEPHFGCCTSNFGQGWPKFALSAFMEGGDKIINVLPIPSIVNTKTADITVKTVYPFGNRVKYDVSAKQDFTFVIRIPSFADNVRVNGEIACGEVVSLDFKKGERSEILLEFEVTPKIEKRPNGLNTVRYGSLVFSLPIEYEKKMYEYEKNGVERKFPYCDYELIPKSEWSYALCGENLQIESHKLSSVPFSSTEPPLTIKATAAKINWGLEDGYEKVCAKLPQSLEKQGEETEITLYPYGCAKLRITEMPII